MEKILWLQRKHILIILVICFVAGGWYLLLYQAGSDIAVISVKEQYVRLHILANSDSLQDQQVKLKVRDAVVAYLTPYVKDVGDAQTAKAIIADRQTEIVLLAQKIAAEHGAAYPATVEIGSFAFPVRTYGRLVLPAGDYQAVRILLGDGAGQNWWCVLFPPLCFIDGTTMPGVAAAPCIQPDDEAKPPEIRWKLAEFF